MYAQYWCTNNINIIFCNVTDMKGRAKNKKNKNLVQRKKKDVYESVQTLLQKTIIKLILYNEKKTFLYRNSSLIYYIKYL